MEEIITKEDLRQFGVLLLDNMKTMIQGINIVATESSQPEWLKSKAVRKMLNISAGSVQNLRMTQKVRFKKVLGSYYYNRADLQKLLLMNQDIKRTTDRRMNYLSSIMDDPKLNVWHLAILSAILTLGYRQGERQIIKVSRTRIMELSHINTLPTYYKYFKELQSLGYIKYTPSYHPGCRSEVEIIKKEVI